MAEDNKTPQSSGLKLPEFKVGKSGMYVLEHFLMLVHVVVALVFVTGMFNHLLDYWADEASTGFLRAGTYETLIGLLAGTAVIVPLFMYFYLRVQEAEKADSKVLKKTWRSIWLNSFLAVLFFWVLGAFISFVTELVDGLLNVGLDDGGEDLWVSLLRNAFVVGVVGCVGMFFYTSARSKGDDDSRRFMVMFTGLAVVLLVLTALWPLAEQRNRRVDALIEDDLGEIASLVDDYVAAENELPADLSDLSMGEDIKSRADKYNYEYDRTSASTFSAEFELCAEFKTDTTGEDAAEESLDFLDVVSGFSDAGSSFPAPNGRDFTEHTDGRYCFDLQSSVYNPFFGDSAEPVNEFDLDSLFQTIQ